jgi:acetyl esterase/lipase
LVAGAMSVVSAAPSVDAAFKAFWDAATDQAAKAAADVVQSGVTFDEAYARLSRGRAYASDVPRGVVKLTRRSASDEFPYTVDVPQTYDPAKKYQVRVQLHGGVMRPDPAARGDGSIGALAGAEQIYVLPQSWAEAQWWAPQQFDNVRAILDSVKRTYNVDENRVVLSGVSDGGTATYYFAMRDTTPYASFLPLNGFILVLRNRDLDLRGALFPHNLTNKPFFVVNGGKDPLYPASRVEPFIKQFEAGGLQVVYKPQPDAVHNTAWWPEVKDSYEAFVREHPRNPHPLTLTWQTDETSTPNRAHWLVVDRLGNARPGEELPNINNFNAGQEPNFGLRSAGMRVVSVLPGSNAMDFGFLPGDIVESINDRSLPRGLELTEFMSIYDAGTKLHFVVSRDNKPVDLNGTYQPAMMKRVSPLFSTDTPAGRVDLVREGNTVRAMTRGVAAFTLLISPDAFDFSTPITVIADGKRVFEGRVEKSLATLMKWAARDNDRTMLYGAEITVTLTQ